MCQPSDVAADWSASVLDSRTARSDLPGACCAYIHLSSSFYTESRLDLIIAQSAAPHAAWRAAAAANPKHIHYLFITMLSGGRGQL